MKKITNWLLNLLNFALTFFWTFFVILLVNNVHAQESVLSEEDKKEIQYKSSDFIYELEALLNLIKDPTVSAYKRNEIITNSYTPSANQIFVDGNVIIEDDIDPLLNDWVNQKNVTVTRYLKDFELFYEKNEAQTVTFKNVQSFEVKKKDYIYLPVYFEVNYTGRHIIKDKPYEPSRRVATIIAYKDKYAWKTLIASIVFYNPTVHTFFNQPKKRDLAIVENSQESSFTAPLKAPELDGSISPAFLKYKENARRGIIQYMSWNNGSWQGATKLELTLNKQVVKVLTESTNIDTFFWKVPKNLALSDKYKYKLTQLNDPSNVVYSAEFNIKRGIPLGVKIALFGLVGGAAVLFGTM